MSLLRNGCTDGITGSTIQSCTFWLFVTFLTFLTITSYFQFLTNTECFSDYFPKSSILTWAYNESEGFDLINIGDGLNVVK